MKTLLLKHKIKLLCALAFSIWFYFLIPDALFQSPNSTVIYSINGKMLGARIADDGQWRFPAEDSIPPKFKRLITLFEDEYFYTFGYHKLSSFDKLHSETTTHVTNTETVG